MNGDTKNENHDGTCPNCGYCRHCGRGGGGTIHPAPYYPHPYPYTNPWYGQPVWIWNPTTTSGGSVSASGTSNMTIWNNQNPGPMAGGGTFSTSEAGGIA